MVRHLTLLCVPWHYCASLDSIVRQFVGTGLRLTYYPSLDKLSSLWHIVRHFDILTSLWHTVRHVHCDEGLPNAAGCPPLAAGGVHGPAPGTRGLPQATRLRRGASVQRGDRVGSVVRWTHQDPLCRRWVCMSSACQTVRQFVAIHKWIHTTKVMYAS